MSVLFSPVGESDPIRGYYDGPLLHILRNYKDIDKVYAFLTSKMRKNKSLVDKAIGNSIKRKMEIKYIETEIEKANDYDIFYNEFVEIINMIKQENADELVYINVSSGTPQMSASLILIASQEKRGNLKAIQVSRPCENEKDSPRVGSEKYVLDEEILLNQDEEFNINRCGPIKMTAALYYSIKARIEVLLDKYEYSTARELYSSSPIYNPEVYGMIAHLHMRSIQQYDDAIKESKKLNYKEKLFLSMIVDKQNNRIASLFETFLIINNLYNTNKINDFLIRFNSYCEYLLIELIYFFFGYDVKDKFCEKEGKVVILKRSKIEKYSSELLKELDDKFNGKYTESAISINAIKVIIDYEILKNNEYDIDISFFDRVEQIKSYRNAAAHTLKVINKVDLEENYNVKGILNSIKKLLLRIAKSKNINEKYFSLYDDANKYIKKEMR